MKVLLVFCIFYVHDISYGQTQTSVYYLSIGSVDYINLDRLPQAAFSASRIEELLKDHADAKGVKFISAPKNKLTKAVFFQQMDKVLAMIKQDKPPNPLMVIYYCGHGFTDTLIGSLFMVAGDFEKTSKTTINEALKANIHIIDILKWLSFKPALLALQGMMFRYVFMFDCCRDPFNNDQYNYKTALSFWGPKLYDELNSTIGILSGPVRKRLENTFRMLDPFVFATEEGSQADIAKYPSNTIIKGDYSDTYVGPISRRCLLFLNQMKEQNKMDVSLNQFIRGITNKSLDTNSNVSKVASREFANSNCMLFHLK